MAAKTLVFNVYDFDRFSKHDQIGLVKLAAQHHGPRKTLEEWRELDPPDDEREKEHLGDLCFSLRYVPTSGKLTSSSSKPRTSRRWTWAASPVGYSTLYTTLQYRVGTHTRLVELRASV